MHPAAFYRNPSLKQWLYIVSLACCGLLAVALIAQYAFNLHPCDLCLLQRYPYAAVAAIGLISAYYVNNPRALFYITFLCGLLLLANAGIAFYHAGVEWGIFPGPSGCSSPAAGEQSLEEMRAAILNAPLVSCSQAMIHVFGLSMAAWNMIAAFILSVATFAVLRKAGRGA